MNVRTSGLLKVIGSGAAFALVLGTVLKNGLGDPSHGGPFKMIAMGVPGAFALAGLIELITGIEFQRLASAWDGLAGWQRGVLGIVIVIVAFALMIAGVAAFA
jgi:hypothetical protein